MYRRMKNRDFVPSRDEVHPIIAGLQNACSDCQNFFLRNRSDLKKSEDVITGASFEMPLIAFLNSMGIYAFKANEIDMRLPDIGIKNRNGDIISLLEVKYHNAPFIMARRFVSKQTECYDGSLTIDVDKCNKQIDIARSICPQANYLIVHWVDFPCIKTVLWDHLSSATGEPVFERRHRAGDYEDGIQVGYTRKKYHCVKGLNDFGSLIQFLLDRSDNSQGR